MKTIKLAAISLVAASAWIATSSAFTARGAAVEKVTRINEQMWSITGHQKQALTDEVELPYEIVVKTNCTFTVGQGKDRKFQEGQILTAEGMMISPDGTIQPVFDHVFMQAGKPRVMRDGVVSIIQADLKLGNGVVIRPDGYIRRPDGRILRLLDGMMSRLDGTVIPTKDTVTLIKGKVVVQKDGSRFEVAPGRSLMMNDGTKVFGDGTLLYRDGRRQTLSEGEIQTLAGVTVRR